MKTIGLIGGMSWESSLEYYRIINERVNHKLGELHSAKILMFSVDFDEIEKLQRQERWAEATKIMINLAQKLQNGGADFIVICTNTMHITADEVQKQINIPILHIADVTAERIKQAEINKVGFIGTKFSMEENFYIGRLINKYGFEVFIPQEIDRLIVHEIIYKELCLGIIKQSSLEKYKSIINNLCEMGAQAVILGCTEITLLVKQADVNIPLFDTTRIHAEAAADFALGF